ncbi:MAG TPA: HAMP domain-containing sensor histidine kinase [Candidatus Nitrosopolaris sp.]|nr:HAMP domain-containing sensor histidine kinase [Candidatus Nitrosopolaris sp.]
MLICSTFGRLQTEFDSIRKVLDKYRKGNHEGIRWLTTIDSKEDLNVVKRSMELGMQIRHIENIPISIVLTNKDFNLTVDDTKDGKLCSRDLISNDRTYLKLFVSLFEYLWKNGINAEQRLKEIEYGYGSSIRVITNPDEILQVYDTLLRSSKKELDIVFPSTKSGSQGNKIATTQLIEEAAERRSVKVRILTPTHDMCYDQLRHRNIKIRYIQSWHNARLTILIVDKEVALVLDLKDNLAEKFTDSVGLATLFEDKSNVMSYVTIVDAFWNEVQLYEQIKDANEQLSLANQKLKTHDKIQQEFINIAAHELKTPLQPLLLSSETLSSSMPDVEDVQIVYRNSKKLQSLANNILDVTRIESNSLRLDKKRINLSDVVLSAIRDMKSRKLSRESKIMYEPQEIFVDADKERITQVVSILLSNALKFTQEGEIRITSVITRGHKMRDYSVDVNTRNNTRSTSDDEMVIISIKDSGVGISPEIQPKLFSKFATKSFDGIGLGLFISKNIVEAHGGKIWAENNVDGEGATFAFSLPISLLKE